MGLKGTRGNIAKKPLPDRERMKNTVKYTPYSSTYDSMLFKPKTAYIGAEGALLSDTYGSYGHSQYIHPYTLADAPACAV